VSNPASPNKAGQAMGEALRETMALMCERDAGVFWTSLLHTAQRIRAGPAKHAPSIRQPDPMQTGNAQEMLEFYQLHIRNNPSDADAIPVIAHVSSEVTWNSAMVRLNIMEWDKYYEAEGTEPRFRRSALKFFQSMQHLDVPPKPTARPPSKEDAAAASKAAAHAQWAEYDAEQAARKGAK